MFRKNLYKELTNRILIILTLILIFNFSSAQNAVVRGKITNKKTGQPILYTHVQLEGTQYGGVTDENGFYTITQIKPGDYTLTVTYIGFDTVRTELSLKKNDIHIENIELVEASYSLKGAEVRAKSTASKINVKTSITKVNPKQIQKLPSVGGTADLAQYLQVVPGVVFTGDQGGQLYIRGGTPVQNKVLLDGMIIYNPFHSIGLFSVFDSDIINNADIYTGGFGAEYGGRISSVMDISTRYGNNKRTAGKISASTFGTKVLLEGPIIKYQKDKGSLSYIISAKKSYIDEAAKTLYPYVNEGDGLPFSFADYYGKISFNSAKGSKLDIFGFNFNDNVSYQTINNYNWKSTGGGINITLVPETSPMMIDANVSFSNYIISMNDGNFNPRSSEINGFNMGLGFTYFYGKNKLNYGVEMKGFETEFLFSNSLNREISQAESTTEISPFVTYKWLIGKMKGDKSGKTARLILNPGFRIQYYASLDNTSYEPRFSAKYNVNPWFRLKFASGMYSQNLISSSSDRDVVNLFSGFISGPDNLQSEFNGQELRHKLQKSNHLVFGTELDIFSSITVNLEAYYKYYPQLTNINRNKIFEDNTNYLDKPDVLKKDFIIEEGDAYGFDFNLKYEEDDIYVWAVYSLGYSNRYDGIIEYVPHFDRRHNVNFLLAYNFGKRDLWEVNTRWNFGSGFPFTPTAGNFESITFEDGIGTDYTTANGEMGFIYGALNSKRLPSYHRLDMGIKRTFRFSEYSELEVNLSITNIYNRNNIFYIDRVTNKRVDQLPVMPSLGINFSF